MDKWFRLRHLQSVRCRNIQVLQKELSNHEIFFALSTANTDNLGYFYKSSKTSNTRNPDWEDIDLSYDTIKSFSFLDHFVINFFVCKSNKNKIILEINIHISGLLKCTDQNSFHQLSEQVILFQFNNIWFLVPIIDDDISISNNSLIVDSSKNDLQQNKSKIHKPMYNKDMISRFLQYLSPSYLQFSQNQHLQREQVESKILHIKSEVCLLKQQRNTIHALTEQIDLLKKRKSKKVDKLMELYKKSNILNQKVTRLSQNSEKVVIEAARSNTYLKRLNDSYDHISQNYMLRMYQLIKELARIFPIEPTISPVPTSGNHGLQQSSSTPTLQGAYEQSNHQFTMVTIRSSDKLSICGLHLPNSDRQILFNQDPSTLAALGMVYRLLLALSQIYDIPLRYPLINDTSKMIVRDDIIEIDDNDRNFLLAKNTSASFKLQYAIYLINLNITAIRGYFSLQTKYPDRTLWNINTLIEGKNKTLNAVLSPATPASPRPIGFVNRTNVQSASHNEESIDSSTTASTSKSPSTPISPLTKN